MIESAREYRDAIDFENALSLADYDDPQMWQSLMTSKEDFIKRIESEKALVPKDSVVVLKAGASEDAQDVAFIHKFWVKFQKENIDELNNHPQAFLLVTYLMQYAGGMTQAETFEEYLAEYNKETRNV